MSNIVKIGNKNKKYFESIVNIVKVCNFDKIDKTDIRVSDDTIEYGDTIFKYVDRIKTIESDGVKFGIGKNGANWFIGLKGGKIDSYDGAWKALIDRVAKQFHKEYSFLEFNQSEDYNYTDNKNFEKTQKIIDTLFQVDVKGFSVEKNTEETFGDVYGAILKLRISEGTGEPQTILCKVYFNQERNGDLTPLPKSVAKDINDAFRVNPKNAKSEGIIKRTSDSNKASESEYIKDVATNVANALIKIMESKDNKTNFDDYCFLHHKERDEEILDELIDKAPSLDEVSIKCSDLSLLSIIHVKWRTDSYIVKYLSKPYFLFSYGLQNRLDVRCLSCKDNADIIVMNMVKNKEEYKDDIDSPEFDIDEFLELEDPYMSKDDFNTLELSNHLIVVPCENAHIQDSICVEGKRLRCISQVVYSKDNDRFYCKNCRHPEVVYKVDDTYAIVNDNLHYVNSKKELFDSEDLNRCLICNRYIKIEDGDYCPICSLAVNNQTTEENIELYKRYGSIIPVRNRIFKMFKPKYGFEDEEMILLKLGNNSYYKINKLDDFNKIKAKRVGGR